MKPVLLDTGCIVALLDRSEARHNECAETVKKLSAPLVTCEPVIAEACYLLRSLRGAPEAVIENIERGVFHIPLRIEEEARPIRALLKRYADVPMDLADACLVHLASQMGTGKILTLDHDFMVYRWQKNHAFEILLS